MIRFSPLTFGKTGVHYPSPSARIRFTASEKPGPNNASALQELGADLMEQLCMEVGKKAFQRGVSEYLQSQDGHPVTAIGFMEALEKATGKNLSRFKLAIAPLPL